MEENPEGDEEEHDEDGEDSLEDDGEDARETHEGLAGILYLFDDIVGCPFDSAGAEEWESWGGERSCLSEGHSRSCARRKCGESRGERCWAITAAEIQRTGNGEGLREGEGNMHRIRRVGALSLKGGTIVGTTERKILRCSPDGEGEGGNLCVVGSGDCEGVSLFDRACVDCLPQDCSLSMEEGIVVRAANGEVDGAFLLCAPKHTFFLFSPHGTVQGILHPEGSNRSLPLLVLLWRLC